MRYTPYISRNATVDIMNAKHYYIDKGLDLDSKFSIEVGHLIERICIMPTAFTTRYKDIRGAKVSSFPFLLFYRTNHLEKTKEIFRVFNTYQKPLWK